MQTTILLADDHRIVREGFRRILQDQPGFEIVGETTNGEETVEFVSQKHPDVVLMDISMPLLSGIDATRRIVKMGLGTRILICSMHDDRTCVEEALRAGASGYVLKDASASELVSAIEAVRLGDSYLSPAITHQVVNAIARPGERPSYATSGLTEREREVLHLIAEGLSSKEIAQRLGISLKTIESHRANVMEKLDIHKVSGLVRFAIRAGLVAP